MRTKILAWAEFLAGCVLAASVLLLAGGIVMFPQLKESHSLWFAISTIAAPLFVTALVFLVMRLLHWLFRARWTQPASTIPAKPSVRQRNEARSKATDATDGSAYSI